MYKGKVCVCVCVHTHMCLCVCVCVCIFSGIEEFNKYASIKRYFKKWPGNLRLIKVKEFYIQHVVVIGIKLV